ncbi:MAG: RluA family pseudouridine synthase [Candidatus Omnitrophota bacterium]|nr:RluA family pseudouridine synthase [Candidatus Omnitrophota bacterium]
MIPIVYEDNWLLIVNKPAGLLTIPALKKESAVLTNILNEDFKKKGLFYHLYPCHRLDKETSGLIIYAKGKSAQKKMMGLFKEQKIKKTYIAFAHGKLSKSAGMIKNPIARENAVTRYEVIQAHNDFAVLKIMPQTGRRNQIRIHLKEIGHPVVGEDKFIFRRDFKLRANRLCLHAQALDFWHPITQKHIQLKIDLPVYLEDFLKKH